MTVPAKQVEGEERLARQRASSVRRTPAVTIGILLVLLLAVGVVTAVDLRRLDTPGGAAQSWVEAALIGDCDRFALLAADPPDRVEQRTDDEVCDALRSGTQDNRDNSASISVRLESARDAGDGTGEAVVVVTRDEVDTPVRLNLVETDRWRVVLDGDACNPVGCP